MSKHTPGPWHWDSDPIKGDPLGRVRYRVTAIGKTVTQCYYSSSDEQAEWDARLIAAAPDLLDALKEERRIRLIGQSPECGQSHWESMRDLRRAAYEATDAAIEKATGEKA